MREILLELYPLGTAIVVGFLLGLAVAGVDVFRAPPPVVSCPPCPPRADVCTRVSWGVDSGGQNWVRCEP